MVNTVLAPEEAPIRDLVDEEINISVSEKLTHAEAGLHCGLIDLRLASPCLTQDSMVTTVTYNQPGILHLCYLLFLCSLPSIFLFCMAK